MRLNVRLTLRQNCSPHVKPRVSCFENVILKQAKDRHFHYKKGKCEIQEWGVSVVSVNHCCGCGRSKLWNHFLKQDSLVFLIVRESKMGVRFWHQDFWCWEVEVQKLHQQCWVFCSGNNSHWGISSFLLRVYFRKQKNGVI